jgi:thiol-disulfide isomerase/thioredoxin
MDVIKAMKKIYNSKWTTLFLVLAFVGAWKCQLLKGPAAGVLSLTLASPDIPAADAPTAPADWRVNMTTLDGDPVGLAELKGKVIFLNFWATWCAPCLAELPDIENLYNRFDGQNVAFALISNEDPQKVRDFVKRKKYKKEHFYMIPRSGSLPQIYHSDYIPTTFIIDKEGRIVHKGVSAYDWDDDDFVEYLHQLESR